MSLSELFNCILIDTNAWDAKGNDFAGRFCPIIPSLQKAIKKNKIVLLSHPVLLRETQNHIFGSGDRSFQKRTDDAVNKIKKCGSILKLASFDWEDIVRKIQRLDLANLEYAAFGNFFSDAIQLPYGNVEKVFDDYFLAKPPFAESGDKKQEFPDAFAINALLNYLDENPGSTTLVVTNDNDWKQALENDKRIVICDNIDNAINLLHGQLTQVNDILDFNYATIESRLEIEEETFWFTIRDYYDAEDIEIETITIGSIGNPVVLDISDEEIRIQVSADLLVDGTARILDLSNSPWDEEEKTFVFMSYGTLFFKKANGSVSFSLTFVPDKNSGWKVNNLEVIIPNGVELVLNDEEVQFKEDFDPTEYQGDVSDTLQEYYFH